MGILLLLVTGTIHTIGNQWMSVGITDALCQVRPGSVLYLNDLYSGTEITGDGQFSGINTGSYIPENGEITVLSDTSLVFHTDHFSDGASSMPIDLTVEYTVVCRGLEMEYRLEYTQDCEFQDPLDIDFFISGWDSLAISNQTSLDECFALDGILGFQRFSGSQLFRLAGGLPDALFLMPNVSKGIAAVLDDPNAKYISVKILDTEEPRENCMGPVLHSIIPAGQVDEYYIRFSLDEYFAPVFIGAHPMGAERSSAWMLDELPLVHPPEGWIWDYSETSDGDEHVSAALISLLEEHPLMKMNWLILPDAILTPNRDSVWSEPGYEDSWSHWHSTWRVPTLAPPEYLQFLQNIQNDVYPWADRVQIGSHGYHHTPNPDSSYGMFHEFITYEPEEHQERFRMNSLDIAGCGLDSNMVRVIRYSGHRTSLSGLQAVIDHGFTFYCNGWRLTDWFAGKQFRNQWITRYQTANGRIWGSNSVWWGDYQSAYPYEYLSEVMDKGKFGLLGCHPAQMLGTFWGSGIPEMAYARIDSVLSSLENDYPNFIWLFPAEYGDFLEDLFSIRVNSICGSAPELSMSFTGGVPEGLTLCAMLHPDDLVSSVTLDGASIPWDIRDGGRLFAVAPERPPGNHRFEVIINPLVVESGNERCSGFGVTAVSPSSGNSLCIALAGIESGSDAEILVHDLSGRRVYTDEITVSSSEVHILQEDTFPSGVYFITVRSQGSSGQARTVVIP